MAKACEECAQYCNMMHKKNKDPASLVTTSFVKVMMGDDSSKTLFLPPNFACKVKKRVGETTHLEDLYGEKWDVTFTKINDRLAFKKGWDTFASKHGLQTGDILVFHYIMKKHFVVLVYGSTGCPELRHFGFSHNPTNETKKSNNNLIVNGQSSSKVHTNCNNLSHESSSKSEPVDGVNNMKTMNKKLKDAKMSSNENTTNNQHLVDKETDQRSELLVGNASPDYMLTESPTTVKPLCLADHNIGHEQDECRRNSSQPVLVESDGGQKNNVVASAGCSDKTETNRIQNLVESDGGLNNNVAIRGGGSDETENNRIRKPVEPDAGHKKNVVASGGGPDVTANKRLPEWLETRITEKRKEKKVIQSEAAHTNSTHKRLRLADVPSPPAKAVKREPVISVSRSHNSCYPSTSTEFSPKPMAKRMAPIKMEPTMNPSSDSLIKQELTLNNGSGGPIKREPKPEPVDYDEAPLSGSSNPAFSAIMTTYQYLELPEWVKVKSRTILLRNGTELWPVLYKSKFGVKALTRSWSIFAKAKGIKPGDKCEFVLESEPYNNFTCSVFDVRVTR